MALCQPFHQTCLGTGQIRIADADLLKAERPSPFLDLEGKCGVIVDLRCCILHKLNDSRRTLALADEAATADLSARLAKALRPGMIIFLRGNLGAGKTTLVRTLLQALGYAGRVKSPSYALVEHYEITGLHLRHFDLYRFRDASEWEAAGFRDEFNGTNICLIEWPEKAQGLLPREDIDIEFDILPNGRKVTLGAHTIIGKKCLATLHD